MTMTFDNTPAPAVPSFAAFFDQLRDLLSAPLRRASRRKATRRELSGLSYLSEYMMRDIGITPSEIRKNDPFLSARNLGDW